MPNTVVLIIDLLSDFFERSPTLAREREAIATATNELARISRQSGLPIIWVRLEFARDLHDAPAEVRVKQIQVTISGTQGCQ